MPLDRVLAWLPLVVLLAMLIVVRLRALAMHRRGVRVIVIDWHRPAADVVCDSVLLVVAWFWIYLLAAEALPLSLAWLPTSLSYQLVDALSVKLVGAALLLAAPLLFVAALRSMGTSWRLGVDRRSPGPLVTDGVFAWMRNPIYVAFDLAILATFLIHGRVVFLLLALALVLLFHCIIRREERFLADRFGDAFRKYCHQVARYGL